ncbi:AlpA family phage regulatory protein [Thiomicrorhabdus sp. 6S2-11]|uniref:AlpA family phage regulatory protein n=1 Tax=Thiomicrorhabdus marina TaxID=2818442 RepID=A0ABS3Q6B6_9GAMM|nr:AlpA family phage regulatory protein [Thiomicrorhabdus marina]MBO1927883.1 AlpA family phage regulatory protein [Thiomicrorhabdus marina]
MSNQQASELNKPEVNLNSLKRFYTLLEVSIVTGYSKSHIRAISKTPSFPSPVKLGLSKTVWIIAEIEDWIEERMAEREKCS